MGIDSEEQEALKDKGTYLSHLIVHPSDYREESIETTELVTLCRMQRSMQVPVVLSRKEKDLIGSRVIWN
jgi:hypothetical protein